MTSTDGKRRFGSFRLEYILGEGGMGVVYAAVHEPSDTSVALKLIRGRVDDLSRERFHREVQAQARLLHPGIVQLVEYGVLDSSPRATPFVAMELADRGSLFQRMRFGTWAEVRSVVRQVLDALAYSHARGVVHRDLKPENLLFLVQVGD